jgi:hypothetical protein
MLSTTCFKWQDLSTNLHIGGWKIVWFDHNKRVSRLVFTPYTIKPGSLNTHQYIEMFQQYQFPFIDELYLYLRGDLDADAKHFLQILAPKVGLLRLSTVDLKLSKEFVFSLTEFIKQCSFKLNSVLFEGAQWEAKHIIQLLQNGFTQNPNISRLSLGLINVTCSGTDVEDFTTFLRDNPLLVEKLELNVTNVCLDPIFDVLLTNDSLCSLSVVLNDKINWDKEKLCRLLSRCVKLTRISLAFGQFVSEKHEVLLEAISSNPSIEVVEINVDALAPLFIFELSDDSLYALSKSRLKVLDFKNMNVSSLKSESLEGLCCSFDTSDGSDGIHQWVLTANPQLKSLTIWNGWKFQDHIIKPLRTNDINLQVLRIPNQKMSSKQDFTDLFEILRGNEELHTLEICISEQTEVKIVSLYLEANIGGLEFLYLKQANSELPDEDIQTKLIESLAQNKRLHGFSFRTFPAPPESSIADNSMLIELELTRGHQFEDVLRRNRIQFQMNCRLLLARKEHQLKLNQPLERSIYWDIFKMSGHFNMPEFEGVDE